eukprot:SAG31_NODE_3616_length_4066_cov_1.641543_6_plen_89_part_00
MGIPFCTDTSLGYSKAGRMNESHWLGAFVAAGKACKANGGGVLMVSGDKSDASYSEEGSRYITMELDHARGGKVPIFFMYPSGQIERR